MMKYKIPFVILTALITTLTTAGGIFVIFYLLIDVWNIPATIAHNPSRAIYFLFLLPFPFLSGGLWGGGVAALVSKPVWPVAKKMAWYWGGTFIVAELAIDFTQLPLGFLAASMNFIPHVIHFWFTLVFVIGVGFFVRLNVQKLLVVLEMNHLAKLVSLRSGFAAAGTFLLTSLLLLFGPGWEVAGPLAGQEYSMISITHVCNFAAAMASGLVLGWMIYDRKAIKTST